MRFIATPTFPSHPNTLTAARSHPSPANIMRRHPTCIAVLGSTGSIGRSTLEVVEDSAAALKVLALTAHGNTGLLLQQAQTLKPRWIAVTDPHAAARQDWSRLPVGVELLIGPESLAQVVAHEEIDIVVSAIVGSAGLQGTWAALASGKTVALANKESLVVGGPLITQLAKQKNARLLPVDSEHSAVFQALQAGRSDEVRRVILTASGGPFRNYSPDQLARVSVADALDHPTWAMGPKITIDSATLMNKALEIIEARWLFDLAPEQISVIIHPQSIVHSMVEYKDGSIIAQMSMPDMKLPIQYALTWPERREGVAAKMDWDPCHGVVFPAARFGAFCRAQARSGSSQGRGHGRSGA